MRFFFFAIILLACVQLNAQWDTLQTGTEIRFNSIAADNTMGIVTCGIGATDSGSYGAIFRSGDNGDTWDRVEPHAWDKNIEFWDLDYTPDGRVWVVGDSGHVRLQTIWFVTYDCIAKISAWALQAGYALGDSVFYCAGEQGVAYRTLNRGITWDTLNTQTTETIHDIYFADVANGWIIGDGGVLKTTSDSGNTWTLVLTPQFGFTDFKSFDYLDTMGLNPYVVGEAGLAQFSIDGGLNWFTIANDSIYTINAIRFGTANAGIMAGDNGFIFRTDNAAWTWFPDPSHETRADLFGVAYMNDTAAFICGDSGVVLRSRNDISAVHPHESVSFTAGAYPNPGSGPLNLQLRLINQSNLTIDVMDMTGQMVHSEYRENVNAGESTLQLNMESLAEGVYFLRVSDGFSAVAIPVIRQ